MGYVVGGCTVQCTCYTEHGRYGLSCPYVETVLLFMLTQRKIPGPLPSYCKQHGPWNQATMHKVHYGNYVQNALWPLTSLKVVVTMETVCVCFCIHKLPTPHPASSHEEKGSGIITSNPWASFETWGQSNYWKCRSKNKFIEWQHSNESLWHTSVVLFKVILFNTDKFVILH